ncbi:mercury resistance system periplasmic binding protein MerP [Methylocapsa polymorpha]|uniref:Periplasmic mercury ion-binding protein n=1 Tax=Methylocapsa polymorpha TaxID=3080828 RepID=A0ABZ0HNC2_9HYPH|nr:mercury resistance system periplasmic binding protein MerP [Methylocapsa sp. RX1]
MRRLFLAAALALPSLAALAGAPQTVTLDVKNMTCPLCPITVRKALEKAQGVAEAKIDFEKKTATVTFDPDRVDPAALVKATTDAGYPSALRP